MGRTVLAVESDGESARSIRDSELRSVILSRSKIADRFCLGV